MEKMILEPEYIKDDNNRNNNRIDSTTAASTPTLKQTKTSANNNRNSLPLEPHFDEDGLVLPRKIINPYIESAERKSLHKEMLWNKKVGKNVLNTKNELERELAKRKDNQKKKELEAERLQRRSSLERRLEEQQLKLRMQEEATQSASPDRHCDK